MILSLRCSLNVCSRYLGWATVLSAVNQVSIVFQDVQTLIPRLQAISLEVNTGKLEL